MCLFVSLINCFVSFVRNSIFKKKNVVLFWIGRRRAAKNLITHGISGLICIGGDGSLTGADILLNEWPQHVAALVADRSLTQEQGDHCPALYLVGFTGTIDNVRI